MDPQQSPSNPNIAAPATQPTIEQIAAGQAANHNLQPTSSSAEVVVENVAQPVETTPQPGSNPVGGQALPNATAALSTAGAPPPAQALHTGSVQSRGLQAKDLANLSASDDDLIEKEWVDTVENVIERDEDDPLVEDIDHNTVSKAYQKQRFNLDVS